MKVTDIGAKVQTDALLRLTKNQLKVIAAIAMLIDHIGAELFPHHIILRIIGRIAFPLFAYSIFEGSKYTRDKKKYLAHIFGLGLICVVGYYFFEGVIYGNVLITFSLSLLILYSIQYFKDNYVKSTKHRLFGIVLICGSFGLAFFLCQIMYIDYGLAGILLPVFVEFFDSISIIPQNIRRLIGFTLGLLILAASMQSLQYYSLLSLPFLAFSSGKRGKYNMKYFFYIFYPVHLVVIGIVSMYI